MQHSLILPSDDSEICFENEPCTNYFDRNQFYSIEEIEAILRAQKAPTQNIKVMAKLLFSDQRTKPDKNN